MDEKMNTTNIDYDLHRFPFCLVWTPIPLITWLFPFVGHMGIATSEGIIRDFAGEKFLFLKSQKPGDNQDSLHFRTLLCE